MKKFEVEEIWSWLNLKLEKFEVEEIWSWRHLKLKKVEVDEILGFFEILEFWNLWSLRFWNIIVDLSLMHYENVCKLSRCGQKSDMATFEIVIKMSKVLRVIYHFY